MGIFGKEGINWKKEVFNTSKSTARIETAMEDMGTDIKDQKTAIHAHKQRLEAHIKDEEQVFGDLRKEIIKAGTHCSKHEDIDSIITHLKDHNGKLDRTEKLVIKMSSQKAWKRVLIADAIKYGTFAALVFAAVIAYLNHIK